MMIAEQQAQNEAACGQSRSTGVLGGCPPNLSKLIHFSGALRFETESHTLEYEPCQMTGARTLYLRVQGGKVNVPIYETQIDAVIEMLQRGKRLILAAEGDA